MMSVDSERLAGSLQALGRIGAYQDEATGLWGVRRLAFSPADGDGRRHVVAKMKALGLDVSVDRIGNVFARREGTAPSAKPVMAGSHIDSVATAGMFDGCLGVLGALEVVQALNDAKVATRRPLVVAFFSEEEGARFGTDMLGSAVATGRVSLDSAWALKDRDGKAVKDELQAIGFLGDRDVRLQAPHAYVECHIEQGPMLRAAGMDLGVVTGVQAISWFELTLTGRSAHAGTTPMSLRADPGVVVAKLQLHLREMTRSGRYGDQLRATVGVTQHHPGLVNVVPGKVTATVDIRHPEDAVLKRAEAELFDAFARFSKEEGVTLAHRQTARTPDVPFAPKVQDLVERMAQARGLKTQRLVSGAGHDCQEMARLCPAGMVFVPGEYDGISHNPREYSTPRQCSDGVNVLLDVLVALANEEGP